MKSENHMLVKKLRTHFNNNPSRLYSIKYFVKKYGIPYRKARYWLDFLESKRYILKFYFSANQSFFAWGIPHPIFSVYVLNKQFANLNNPHE